MEVLGLDVGGSGIRAAVIDTERGRLVSPALSRATPQPATPEALVAIIADQIAEIGWSGPVGCGFPAVIRAGRAATAANIDDSWIGFDVAAAIEAASGCPSYVINDADAAGIAEMYFAGGHDEGGTVLMLTLGTGIGSALFHDGRLVPNLELGSLPYRGGWVEHYAAAAVRTRSKLSWQRWGERLNRVLQLFERLLSPDLIIVGGGVSSNSQKFFPYLTTRAQLIPARLGNRAGMIGAAWQAVNRS